MNLKPGDIFEERFEIISLLGSGGMAAVFHARQLDADRDVAIKLPFLETLSSDDGIERFYRESKILASINSPHIMTIYGFGKTSAEVPFAICEYLNGETLRTLIHNGMLPWKRAVVIAIQIALGLQDAHNLGVVHRDLKPENVFLLDKPEPDFVKIIDFGLSKMFMDLSQSQKLTSTGLLVGTAGYMAPEQIAGTEIDHRADIYALGCILFEMLSGKKLFEADSSIGMIYKHSNESPESQIIKLRPAVPEDLLLVLRRCLAKKPEDRFEKMSELVESLHSVREGAARNAFAQFFQKQRISGLAVLLVVLSSLFVGLIVFRSQNEPVERSAEKMVSVPRRLKILYSRTNADFQHGNLKQALLESRSLIDLLTKNPQVKPSEFMYAYSIYVHCLLELGREDEADKFLDDSKQIFEKTKENTSYFSLRAMIEQRRRNYDLALKYLQQASITDPDSTSISSMKASTFEQMGDWKRAIAEYEKYLKQVQKSGVSYSLNNLKESPLVLIKLRIAYCYCESGDYAASLAICKDILENYPEYEQAYVQIARTHDCMGNRKEALAAENTAIELNPNNSALYDLRAWTYCNLGEYRKAIADSDASLRLDPKNAVAYNNKARATAELGDINAALELCARALKEKPRVFYAHEQRAYWFCVLGRWREQLSEAEKEIQLRPNSSNAHLLRASALFMLQKLGESKSEFEEVLAKEPNNFVALINLSKIESMQRNFQRANELLEKANKYKDRRSQTDVLLAKSFYLVQSNEIEKALDSVNKVFALLPEGKKGLMERRFAFCLRAMIESEQGKHEQALKDFEQSLANCSTDAYIFQQRAKLYEAMNEPALAMKDKERAAELLR